MLAQPHEKLSLGNGILVTIDNLKLCHNSFHHPSTKCVYQANVDTYYFISYIHQHISTLANHHQGEYNFKESEASNRYNCTGIHRCRVYYTPYKMQECIMVVSTGR